MALTEGRRPSAVRVAGIEGGVESASFAPLLSALAIPLLILACGRRARLVAVDPGMGLSDEAKMLRTGLPKRGARIAAP
jgi:hypothetical protein